MTQQSMQHCRHAANRYSEMFSGATKHAIVCSCMASVGPLKKACHLCKASKAGAQMCLCAVDYTTTKTNLTVKFLLTV